MQSKTEDPEVRIRYYIILHPHHPITTLSLTPFSSSQIIEIPDEMEKRSERKEAEGESSTTKNDKEKDKDTEEKEDKETEEKETKETQKEMADEVKDSPTEVKGEGPQATAGSEEANPKGQSGKSG